MPSPIINPTLRLEPGLGLVVIEFRNDTGAVTTSIPSQRQLQAYQRWDVTHFGPTPLGRRSDPPTGTSTAPPSAPNAPATPPGNEEAAASAPTRASGQMPAEKNAYPDSAQRPSKFWAFPDWRSVSTRDIMRAADVQSHQQA
jgi:hypothetical protein